MIRLLLASLSEMRLSVADCAGRHSLSMMPHCVKKYTVAVELVVR